MGTTAPLTIDSRERLWMMMRDRSRSLDRDVFDAIYDAAQHIYGYEGVAVTPVPFDALHEIVERYAPRFYTRGR